MMTGNEVGVVFRDPPRVASKARNRLPARVVAPDSHRPHGTYVKYVVERCGCEPCRKANRDYENRRQHAMRRPDEVWMPYVPAAPVRRHVARLAEFGIGPKQLVILTGVSHGAVSKLIYGDPKRKMAPSKRVRLSTAEKLLAVQSVIDNLGVRVPVPGAPYRAMIDDLVARRFPKVWIARRIHHPNARAIQIGGAGPRRGDGTTIGAGVAVKIRDLYASLDGQTGPGKRSRWDDR